MAVIVNGDGILTGVSSLTTALDDLTSGRGTITGVTTVGTLQLGAGVSISSPRSQNAAIFTNNSEFLTVDDAGRVGVGTVTPNTDAHPQNVGKINVGFITARSVAGDIDANTMVVAGVSTFTGAIDANGNIAGQTAAFAQNIAIRLSSATNNLHVHQDDSDKSIAQFTNNTTGSASGDGFQIGLSSSEEALLNMKESSNMIFKTADTERARIDSSGRLLIGTDETSSNQSGALNVFGTNGDTAFVSIRRGSNNASGPRLAFGKSRNTTDGAASGLVSNGDILGTIHFYGNDSQGFEEGAAISAEIDGTPGSNDLPTRLLFHTTPNGSDTKVERVRIDSAGQVGINDTSPDAELSVAAVSGHAPHVDIGQAGGNRLKLGYEGNNCFFGASASSGMFVFKQNVNSDGHPQASGTERMRINNNGRLLLNTTSQVSIEMFGIKFDNDNDIGIALQNQASGSATFLKFINPSGTELGTIKTSTGSNLQYNTSSDYRLKENVTAISDGITRLKTLKPSRFNFKSDVSTTVDGFLAHEVTAVPEAISGTKDEVDSDNNPVYQGIDQSKLVPLLTAALQEAVTKIETLETKVAALEGS